MSTIKEQKPIIYALIRANLFDHLVAQCDNFTSKRGKEPISMFWKAFGLIKLGRIDQALQVLESFQSRRDLLYPVCQAMLYAHNQSVNVDQEAVETLTAELSVAEDVTKEPGMLLAARFSLFVGDYDQAKSLCQSILSGCGNNPSTNFEWEAYTIDMWCAVKEFCYDPWTSNPLTPVEELSDYVRMKIGSSFDSLVNGKIEQMDVDLLVLYALCKKVLGVSTDALNILNQIVASNSWFSWALVEKSIILADLGDWDQALDTAQRVLDMEPKNIVALEIIAVHSFTQEIQANDSIMKLEDLEKVVAQNEPQSPYLALHVAHLFASICGRSYRALQICVRFLERLRNPAMASPSLLFQPSSMNTHGVLEGHICVELGHLYLMMGSSHYGNAMKCFQEGVRRDPNSLLALEGLVQCQLLEGQFEDAEGQMELLLVMHNLEELSSEFSFSQALLAQYGHHDGSKHLEYLDNCRQQWWRRQELSKNWPTLLRFNDLWHYNADLGLRLAVEYLSHVESLAGVPLSVAPAGSSNATSSDGTKTADNGKDNQGATVVAASPALAGATLAYGLGGAGATIATGAATPSNANGGLTYAAGVGNGNMTLTTLVDGNGLSAGSSNTSSDNVTNAMMMGDGSSNLAMESLDLRSEVYVSQGIRLLSSILHQIPGFVSAYIELARLYMLQRRFQEAERWLRQCLNLQSNCLPALLLSAQLELAQGHTAVASRHLEQCLAADFQVRSIPYFRLLQVLVSAQLGKLDESVTELQSLTSLSDFRPLTNSIVPTQQLNPLRLTEDDKVTAYLALAILLSQLQRMKEVKQLLNEIKVLFASTVQEVQVLIASAQLAVDRGDYESALRMLDKVSPDSPTYERSLRLKAEILLVHHRDKDGFIECFQKLVEQKPTIASYGLLGDAYLRILHPEAAVQALEKAYAMDSSNPRLRARIGRALVATHEYHRAIDFYEAAIRETNKALTDLSGLDNRSASGKSDKSGNMSSKKKWSPEQQALQSELVQLSHQLARLYFKLGRNESAGRVLNSLLHPTNNINSNPALMGMTTVSATSTTPMPSHAGGSFGATSPYGNASGSLGKFTQPKDLIQSRQDVSTLLLLADKSIGNQEIIRLYARARDIQREVVSTMRNDPSSSSFSSSSSSSSSSSNVNSSSSSSTANNALASSSAILAAAYSSSQVSPLERERYILSEITSRLGWAYINSSSLTSAIDCFVEALQTTPSHASALLGMARIHKTRGETSLCQAQCHKIVHLDPGHEEAAILLTEVMVSSASYDIDEAIKPLELLLTARPTCYSALAKMIIFLRRGGRLITARKYLDKAEQSDPRSASSAGFHYCQGLFARYTNDIGKAIAEFNLARLDDTWGVESLIHMIELYLNPDQEGAWEERGDGVGAANDITSLPEAFHQYLQAAETLLKELENKIKDPLRFKILESYYLLATRQKGNISKAMSTLISILEKDQDYLPGILAMSTGFMVEKNPHKARNLLKRVAKIESKDHDREDFTKANLLLAKFYVDKAKFDLAQELCQRCLAINKSDSEAWEIMGLIMERSSDYERAAECYEKAWKLDFEASASVGFKLSFALLKCKKFVECIDICESVLRLYPDYPRIREEILRKAQQSIRTK